MAQPARTVTIKKAALISGAVFAALLVLTPALAAPPATHPAQISFVANGGTSRTLAAKLGDVVSIKDYGAVCDGVTDDTVAIQAAVTAAISLRGSVFVPPSSLGCVIPTGGAGVFVTGPVDIYGTGAGSLIYVKGSTWKVYAQAGYVQVSNPTTTIAHVHFHHLHFIGDYPLGTPGPSGATPTISFNNSSSTLVVNDATVDHVTFEKLGGAGVGWNGGSFDPTVCCQYTGNAVTNSIFINSGSINDQVNPFSGGGSGTIVSGNTFKDIQAIAIEWAGMAGVITGNYFDSVHGSALSLEQASAQTGYTSISDNVMKDTGQPLSGTINSPCIQLGQSNGAFRVRVIGNSMKNCGGGGVVAGGSVSSSDIDVSNNYIDCPGRLGLGHTTPLGFYGIVVGGFRLRVRIVNNTVVACTGANDTSVYGIVTGGLTIDTWTDGNNTIGTFSSRAFILNTSSGFTGHATRSYIGRNIDVTAGIVVPPSDFTDVEMIPQFASLATTPSIAGSNTWTTVNAGATTITNFTSGSLGQVITVFFQDSLTTLPQGGSFRLAGNVTRTYLNGEVSQFLWNGFQWIEVTGSKSHFIRSAGCATAASVGAICSTVLAWNAVFPDSNYTATCTGDGVTSGVPVNGGFTTKTATGVTFQTVAATAAAAQYGTIDCVATHD